MNEHNRVALADRAPIPVPEGLTPGFIIHVGALGPDAQPYLQIGLTPDDLAGFDTTLNMNRYTGDLVRTFPVTGYPTYSQRVTNAGFSWQSSRAGGRSSPSPCSW